MTRHFLQVGRLGDAFPQIFLYRLHREASAFRGRLRFRKKCERLHEQGLSPPDARRKFSRYETPHLTYAVRNLARIRHREKTVSAQSNNLLCHPHRIFPVEPRIVMHVWVGGIGHEHAFIFGRHQPDEVLLNDTRFCAVPVDAIAGEEDRQHDVSLASSRRRMIRLPIDEARRPYRERRSFLADDWLCLRWPSAESSRVLHREFLTCRNLVLFGPDGNIIHV